MSELGLPEQHVTHRFMVRNVKYLQYGMLNRKEHRTISMHLNENRMNRIPGLLPIFLHGCEIKSGNGLGTRLSTGNG